MDDTAEMTCPGCGGTMAVHHLRDADVARCPQCRGIFLARADLGALSEAENDWHRGTGHHTEPLPRISAEMTAPPPSPPRARSFLETLFG